MANTNLTAAKRAKNDEFYTQYHDIEREMNAYLEFNPNVFRDKTILLPCDDPEWSNFTKYFAQNFKTFGIKKLISTSYAFASKGLPTSDPVVASNTPPTGSSSKFYQTSLFELNSPQYDASKTKTHGKIFTLVNDDISGDNKIDINDLQWQYLEGDGDFRSDEVKKLRDEADIIITNPPFSLFREFLAWIVESNKQFSIIGNMNAITYKEVFPLIASNQIWLGNGFQAGNAYFESAVRRQYAEGVYDQEAGLVKFRNCHWFTNIEHGRRHQPLPLMTMEQNLKFSKHKEIRGKDHYEHYDNYDAIEVPYTDAIPSNYDGVMGVPISFLDKYCPEQFNVLGIMQRNEDPYKIKRYTTNQYKNANDLNARGVIMRNGKPKSMYARILIKKKEATC